MLPIPPSADGTPAGKQAYSFASYFFSFKQNIMCPFKGGNSSRGTLKQPVFGVFERDGRVYTELVPDCKRLTLQAVILGKVSIESVIYSDGWRGYNGLVDVGYSKHFRVSHGDNEFARMGIATLMALNRFGVLPSGDWQSLTAYQLTLNCI